MSKKLEFIGWVNESQSDSGRYTIIRNFDDKLKHDAVKLAPDVFRYMHVSDEWKFEGFDGDEAKITQGRNVLYIPKADYEEAISDAKEQISNKNFDVVQEFFKQFGILYHVQLEEDYYAWNCHALIGGQGGDMSTIWQTRRKFVHQKNRTGNYSIEISYEAHGSVAFMKFNDDGDFINRDYNFDIEKYFNCQEQPDYAKVYNKFVKAIQKLGPAKKSTKSDSVLFYDGYAAEVNFESDPSWNKYKLELNFIKDDGTGKFKPFRGKAFTEPKKNVEVLTANAVVEMLEAGTWGTLKQKFLADDKLNFSNSLKGE